MGRKMSEEFNLPTGPSIQDVIENNKKKKIQKDVKKPSDIGSFVSLENRKLVRYTISAGGSVYRSLEFQLKPEVKVPHKHPLLVESKKKGEFVVQHEVSDHIQKICAAKFK